MAKLAWLAKGREKVILELCEQHMNQIVKTVEATKGSFEAFLHGDEKKLKELYKEVFSNERAADDLKKKILEELSRGILHPMDREELVRLVMISDEIAANAKAASGKLCYIPPAKICRELREIMREFAEKDLEAVKTLREALDALRKGDKSVLKLAHEVERKEEEIDEFRHEKLFPKLLKWHREIKDTGLSFLLEKTLENLETLADLCEDVSDIIRCVAVSR